ncbi:MAG TPA: NAD(P)/FAD-dependent oxidoreductase, partial [Kiloniellales bacterium]|nr:NAD(P)/FAD-dependent oxidoreductase [Kiloniellales bacterium]
MNAPDPRPRDGTMMTTQAPSPARPRVVIIGAGFGGLAAAKALGSAEAEVVLVDKRNYHLFQPLLYQVATAGLSPAQIAWPARAILRRQKNAHTRLARVTAIDLAGKAVQLGRERMSYDYLVVATGARHAYFGHDEWEPFAPGLKKIEDATAIRRRLLLAFEQAETATDPAERKALLTFAVIGGGPTGVELAGAIAELARHALAEDFRSIDPRDARVMLIEAGPRLLPAMVESLSAKAKRTLEKLGVEVRLGQAVTDCTAAGLCIGAEFVPARTLLWAAGVAASPAAKWLNAEKDRAGRVKVAPDLSLPGHPEVFVVGDTASVVTPQGKPVPGIAPAAKQMGSYVAKTIAARLKGRPAPPPFRYRHTGDLATIGRSQAVVDFGWIKFSGFFAWWLWSIAHIYFLIGFRTR